MTICWAFLTYPPDRNYEKFPIFSVSIHHLIVHFPLLTWKFILFRKKCALWHLLKQNVWYLKSYLWILFPTPLKSCPNFKYLLKFGFDSWTPYLLGQCHEICTFFILKSPLKMKLSCILFKTNHVKHFGRF